MPWYRLSGGMLPSSQGFKETELLNDDSADMSGGRMLVVLAATVLALEAKSRLRGWMVFDVVKLTRVAVEVVERKEAAALGPTGGVAAGRIHSGVTLPAGCVCQTFSAPS